MLYQQLVTGISLGNEILVEGRAGTGKTTSILSYVVQACYTWPGCKVLLCRDTRTSLTESVMATLEDEVLGPDHPACQGADRGNRTHYQLGESRMVCGGLDKPERLFSTAWDIIYFAEAIEATRDKWELFGRSQRPRRLGLTAAPFRQRIGDTNPSYPTHWLNIRATPASDAIRRSGTKDQYRAMQRFNYTARCTPANQMRRLITCHQDNPGYWDADAWTWTPAGLEMLAGLEGMSGHNRARMLDGRWVAAEGTVFPEFNMDIHVVNDFEPPADWPWFIGWDPGFDHPTAVIFITVGPSGDIFIADEVYAGGFSVAEHVHGVPEKGHRGVMSKIRGRTIKKFYGDPHEFFSSRAQGKSCAIQCKEAGLSGPFYGWANQEKQAMVNYHRQLLQNTVSEKHPGLFVMRRCKNTMMEYQTWSFKRNSDGTIPNGDDAYVDADNHAMDVITGMLNTGKMVYS